MVKRYRSILLIVVGAVCGLLLSEIVRSKSSHRDGPNKNVKIPVRIQSLESANDKLKIYSVKALKDAIGMDSTAKSIALNLRCCRDDGRLSIVFWSWRAKDAIIIEPAENNAAVTNVSRDANGYLSPQPDQGLDSMDDEYSVGTIVDGEKVYLHFKKGSSSHDLPWNRKVHVYPVWFSRSYPLGVVLMKDTLSAQYTGAAIIDKSTDTIAAEIEFPADNDTPFVPIVLDEKMNVVMFFDRNLDWIIVVDLASLAVAGKSQ